MPASKHAKLNSVEPVSLSAGSTATWWFGETIFYISEFAIDQEPERYKHYEPEWTEGTA